jgi:hypothetical protein
MSVNGSESPMEYAAPAQQYTAAQSQYVAPLESWPPPAQQAPPANNYLTSRQPLGVTWGFIAVGQIIPIVGLITAIWAMTQARDDRRYYWVAAVGFGLIILRFWFVMHASTRAFYDVTAR